MCRGDALHLGMGSLARQHRTRGGAELGAKGCGRKAGAGGFCLYFFVIVIRQPLIGRVLSCF